MDGESLKNYCNTIPGVKSATVDSNRTEPIVGSLIDVDTDTSTVAMKPIQPLATTTTTTTTTITTLAPVTTTTTTTTTAAATTTIVTPGQTKIANDSVVASDSKQPGVDSLSQDEAGNIKSVIDLGDKNTIDVLALQQDTNIAQKYAELKKDFDRLKLDKIELEGQVDSLTNKLETSKAELEREVQRRVELEQRYTEEAKRTSEQIETLIVKDDNDNAKFNELKRKFDMYTRETSSMIENFITNRELLASQLIEMKRENDHLLGKYLSKANDLQNAEIDLPQTVEELQFYCLTLNEKLILATLAKERLEETMVQNSANTPGSSSTTMTTSTPATTTTSGT